MELETKIEDLRAHIRCLVDSINILNGKIDKFKTEKNEQKEEKKVIHQNFKDWEEPIVP